MTASFGRRSVAAEGARPVKLVPEAPPQDEEPLDGNKAIVAATILGALLLVAVGTGMYYFYTDSIRQKAKAARDMAATNAIKAAESYFSLEEAKKRARNEIDILDFKIRDLHQQMRELR